MEANPFDAIDPVAVEVAPPVVNPFDRFDNEADAGDPGLGERWRLNEAESYYRGTLRGSSALSTMATIVKMRNEGAADDDILDKVAHPFQGLTEQDFATPQEFKSARSKWVKDKAAEYNSVTTDLARYDVMKPFGDTLEAGAALTGALAGGLQSPESFLGAPAKGASWLVRTAKAGLQQAGIMGVTDPVVQANNMAAQTQAEYEPSRTAGAVGLGFLLGGGIHLATGELIPAFKVRRTIAEASAEDPSFRRADIAPEAAPAKEPPVINVDGHVGETVIDVNGKRTVIRNGEVVGESKPAPVPEAAPAGEPAPAGTAESAPAGHGEAQQRIGDGVFVQGDKAFVEGAPRGDYIAEIAKGDAPLPTVDELKRAVTATSDADRRYSNAIGIDDAAYKRLRELNRIIDEGGPRADEAIAEKDAILAGKASHELDIADEGALRQLLREFGSLERQGDETLAQFEDGIARVLKRHIVGYTDGDDFARAVFKKAFVEATDHGFDTRKLGNDVIDRFMSDLSESDRAFMREQFAQFTRPKVESAPPVAASDTLALRAEGDTSALAERRGGGALKMERARPDVGISDQQGTTTGTAVATVGEPPSPAKEIAIRSLQQQAMDFADAVGFPLREGRVTRGALGIYKVASGVVRVKEVPDFEVVAHEAGHAIEVKVGKSLTDLTNTFGTELSPLVSAPGKYDPAQYVKEGFAEWIRRYIGNPAHAEQVAPGFTIAFRDFMEKKAPDILKAIDNAGEAYRAYLEAPSVDAIGAVRRSQEENLHGWRAAVNTVREDGFFPSIKSVMQKVYTAVLDDKAPVTRAVRDLARAINEKTGKTVDLKGVDNPDTLIRLAQRSQQAALHDMMDGVRPYHSIEVEGPSLSDALAKATGDTSWGKWNPELKGLFSDYLIARRASVLWDKFKRGDLPNPPAAFAKGDAVTAMADLERANPTFREASDMVHDWTRQLLRKQFEGGLIGKELYDKLLKEEFYVPFMRDLSDKPLANEGVGGSAADSKGAAETIKRMTGSSRDIKDPIESLMMQSFLVNRTLQHNDAVQALVRLAKQAGSEGGRYAEPIPAKEMRKYNFDLSDSIERAAREKGLDPDEIKVLTGSLTDVFGKDPIVGSFFHAEPAGKRGEPIVFYKEGGELRAVRLMAESEGHALYETMTALPDRLTDTFSELVATTSSVMRSGVVTNPMFAVTNYIRDQFAVGILRGDYVPMVSGLKGIAQEFGQGEAAKLYAYGGGVAPGSSIAPIERAIEADVNALAKKGYIVNRTTSFKGLLELASFTEAGTRNSVFSKVFEAKKAQGLSDYEAMIEAAFQSTDLLDFSRHGSRTMAIRQFLPFLNAHFQGVDKAKRTILDPIMNKMKGDEVFAQDSDAFRNAMLATVKVFGVGGVLGAGWAALNADSEAYRDASPNLKGTHVIIPWGRNIVLWPKPFELGVGFTAGEYAYQRMAQGDPRAAEQFVKAAWQALEPPNPLQDIPLLKTYFELKSGKNLYTGNDIVPDRLARLAPAQQYSEKTSSLARYIGSQINVSPIKIDYAVGSMFGSWGRDVMTLSSGVDPDAPAQSWEDTVFLRRLIKDPARTSDVTTKYWGFMGLTTGTYNQDVNTYDHLVKSFKENDAKGFLNKLPAPERAFVIMKSAADEDGKPAFDANAKRLHPLQRSYDAVTLLNGVRRELNDNAFKTYESGENVKLSPVARRDLMENIRELAQMEMRNSFVIMKEPGYTGRPLLDVNGPMEKIRALSPQVADEIATRYATAKIYKTDDVVSAYPKLQSALIRDGSAADVADLVDNAAANGTEFGGERVRKPQKRRVRIAP